VELKTSILATAAILTSVAARPARGGDEIELASGGVARSTIIVGPDATEPEKHAAAELARFLGEISGAEFAVKTAAEAAPGPRILVGPGPHSEKVIAATEIAGLGQEGYLIRASGGDLAIAGGRPRGTLYGVYSFLEDRLGCRWFTPQVSRIVRQATVRVDRAEKRYVPPLEYRATDYPGSRDGDFAARNKLNGTQTRVDARRGGKIDYHHFVHSFNDILNPRDHFAAHPEYFSQIKGKRIADQAQLCLTNPEVLRIAIETVRRWMRERPVATIFSVSQNDWHNPCECAGCAAVVEEEGAQSGPLLRFVNAIALAVKDEFPGKAIDTLAYQYTRKPPARVRPQPNVIVRLCSIECCFSHPLESGSSVDPENARFAADLRAWSKVCDRLYIWDYVIDYSHSIMPFPNLLSLKPNAQTFIANGVKGIYEEADYFTAGGEMAELRTYVLAKTLWDPTHDTHRAIQEFLDGFYEEAAGPIGEYLDLIHQKAIAEKIHFNIWAGPGSPLFSADLLGQADHFFDAAEARVSARPAALHRVRVARLPLVYVRAEQSRAAGVKSPAERAALKGLLDRFQSTAEKEGLTMVSEGKAYDAWRSEMRKLCEEK
jgi:uncharacterized protein DUF4838/glycosyl hydrolase family 67